MQDGQTRKVGRETAVPLPAYYMDHRVALVTVAGVTAGNEYELSQERTTVGRGPGVDIAFDDTTMSREHAAFEFTDDALRIRDLGSTNGVLLNGGTVLQAELKNGDRIELGDHRFQIVLEPREREREAYLLPDD